MERMWYSRKYDWSPMPYALFFRGGYAIHGTYSIRQLGRPASHGCVRLPTAFAKKLYGVTSIGTPVYIGA
jgi:lipoprotein-anchoring transpeptidase ErfK/SrfK